MMASRSGARRHEQYSFTQLRRALRATNAAAPLSSQHAARHEDATRDIRRRERFVVEQGTNELLVRIRLDGARGANDAGTEPAVITQRNCHEVGLSKRQFLELVRAGTIPGGPIPGTRIIAAKLEDVLRVVEQAAERPAAADYCDEQDDVDAVLAAVGQQRRPGGR